MRSVPVPLVTRPKVVTLRIVRLVRIPWLTLTPVPPRLVTRWSQDRLHRWVVVPTWATYSVWQVCPPRPWLTQVHRVVPAMVRPVICRIP